MAEQELWYGQQGPIIYEDADNTWYGDGVYTEGARLTGQALVEGNPTLPHHVLRLEDLSKVWPIGSVYLAVVSTNPATLLGFGTWSQIAQGQMLVGFLTADPDFGTLEGTGGAKSINIQHNHSIDHTHGAGTLGGAGGAVNDAALSGINSGNSLSTTQSILNPYFTVYIWKRTA
jgi:hypothetical protein